MIYKTYAMISRCMVLATQTVLGSNNPYPEELVKQCYGNDAYSIECTNYEVKPNDRYEDGVFKRYNDDGTYIILPRINTDSDDIKELKQASDNTSKNINKISDDITDVQLALAELYESGAALS